MKTTPGLICLHGFLGLPHDWMPVLGQSNEKRIYPNLWRDFPIQTFDAWAAAFNSWAAKCPSPKILVGYSLGGRLAMHALRQDPAQWAGAVLISANLGLVSAEQKAARLKADLEWAEKMGNAPWEVVMEQWNAQPIFQDGENFPVRNEKDFDRSALVEGMKKWSVAAQEDLQNTLFCLKMPVLWLVGSKDERGISQVERLRFSNPNSQRVQIENGGHRLLVDQPVKIREEIDLFIRNIP